MDNDFETIDFQKLRFEVFKTENIFFATDLYEGDIFFYNKKVFDSIFFVIKTFKAELQTNIGKFTVIHINIRNLNTNIDKLKYFLIECKCSFKKKELLHSFECKSFFSSECIKLSLF